MRKEFKRNGSNKIASQDQKNMTKHKILGAVNILLALLFAFIFTSFFNRGGIPLLEFLIQIALPAIIALFSIFTNLYLAYKLLFLKDEKSPYKLYLMVTLSTIFWFLLILIGYFMASSAIFPLVILILTALIYYFLNKISRKTAIAVSLIALITLFGVIVLYFEESYCVNKGYEADKSGSSAVTATKNDEKMLKSFGIKEGNKIGIAFRAHMLCHQTFKYKKALKEKYPFLKFI